MKVKAQSKQSEAKQSKAKQGKAKGQGTDYFSVEFVKEGK